MLDILLGFVEQLGHCVKIFIGLGLGFIQLAVGAKPRGLTSLH